MNNPYQSPVSQDTVTPANSQKAWVIAPVWRRAVAFLLNRILILWPFYLLHKYEEEIGA